METVINNKGKGRAPLAEDDDDYSSSSWLSSTDGDFDQDDVFPVNLEAGLATSGHNDKNKSSSDDDDELGVDEKMDVETESGRKRSSCSIEELGQCSKRAKSEARDDGNHEMIVKLDIVKDK